MRENLKKIVNETITLEYVLPNGEKSIEKSFYTFDFDYCFSSLDDQALSDIIYNTIIEYSYAEQDLDDNLENLHSKALMTKIKFDEEADDSVKIKYGFYGEVLLYVIMKIVFGSDCLISRGYFYSPLESSEAKGYDCFHILQNGDQLELWFGETKFRKDCKSSLKEIIEKLPTVISDGYLKKNLYAIFDRYDRKNKCGTKLDKVFERWTNNVKINLLEELTNEDITLVYPCLVIGDYLKDNYDENISEIIKYIKTINVEYNISLKVKMFFIFLPVVDSEKIKEVVLECIKNKKQLIL